jgi:hypothetical protein
MRYCRNIDVQEVRSPNANAEIVPARRSLGELVRRSSGGLDRLPFGGKVFRL